MRKLKIIECPRDAMQSIKEFIPTDKKINMNDTKMTKPPNSGDLRISKKTGSL